MDGLPVLPRRAVYRSEALIVRLLGAEGTGPRAAATAVQEPHSPFKAAARIFPPSVLTTDMQEIAELTDPDETLVIL